MWTRWRFPWLHVARAIQRPVHASDHNRNMNRGSGNANMHTSHTASALRHCALQTRTACEHLPFPKSSSRDETTATRGEHRVCWQMPQVCPQRSSQEAVEAQPAPLPSRSEPVCATQAPRQPPSRRLWRHARTCWQIMSTVLGPARREKKAGGPQPFTRSLSQNGYGFNTNRRRRLMTDSTQIDDDDGRRRRRRTDGRIY